MRTLCTLALLALAPGASAEDPKKEDLARLAGTWTVESIETEGHARPYEVEGKPKATLVFDGDSFKLSGGGKPGMTCRITRLTTAASGPGHIDLKEVNAELAPPHPGIYELDGDTLRICLAEYITSSNPAGEKKGNRLVVTVTHEVWPRPEKFTSKEANLLVLKRKSK